MSFKMLVTILTWIYIYIKNQQGSIRGLLITWIGTKPWQLLPACCAGHKPVAFHVSNL